MVHNNAEEHSISNDFSKKEEALKIAHFYGHMFTSCPMISSDELHKALCGEKRSVDYLIDVRERGEQEVSIIPSAILKGEFENMLHGNSPPPKDASIVVYCTVGYRSGVYATYLKDKYGYQNVRNSEGIVLYTHVPEAQLVRKNTSSNFTPSYEVHTYGATWDLAASGFKTVQFGPLTSLSARIFQTFVRLFCRCHR
jgi:rhodanese-related sulfurtransferase